MDTCLWIASVSAGRCAWGAQGVCANVAKYSLCTCEGCSVTPRDCLLGGMHSAHCFSILRDMSSHPCLKDSHWGLQPTGTASLRSPPALTCHSFRAGAWVQKCPLPPFSASRASQPCLGQRTRTQLLLLQMKRTSTFSLEILTPPPPPHPVLSHKSHTECQVLQTL